MRSMVVGTEQGARRGPTVASATRAIDPASDRPVYKQIADMLRQRMDAGDIAPGGRLPSESELMQQFGVARATVRRSFDLLAMEGRVRTVKGVGVFARAPTAAPIRTQRAERLARRHRTSGKSALEIDAERTGARLTQEIVERADVPAPPLVARCLDIPGGQPVFVRRRVIAIEGSPAQLADSYIPLDIAVAPVREQYTGPGRTYARIEEQGHRLTRFREQLTFRMPTPDEVRALHLDVGVPVIDLVRVAYTDDRPVECFVSVLAGDKHRFEYHIDVDTGVCRA